MPMCMRPRAEGGPSADECIVCGPWPPAQRAKMRTWLTVIPLREDVCELCLKAWKDTLPKVPPPKGH